MPDQSIAEASLQLAVLIREALVLADRLELPVVAIHLDQAQVALEPVARPKSQYLS